MPTKNKAMKQISGMVDNSDKDVTKRVAIASGVLFMGKDAFNILMKQGSPKGNVWEVAKVAAVIAAKKTPDIVPFCHPLELNKVKVTFETDAKKSLVRSNVEVVYVGKTGVEMEALAAVSASLLTIYDMMKWADKGMVIKDIKLLHKSGGKSGTFERRKD